MFTRQRAFTLCARHARCVVVDRSEATRASASAHVEAAICCDVLLGARNMRYSVMHVTACGYAINVTQRGHAAPRDEARGADAARCWCALFVCRVAYRCCRLPPLRYRLISLRHADVALRLRSSLRHAITPSVMLMPLPLDACRADMLAAAAVISSRLMPPMPPRRLRCRFFMRQRYICRDYIDIYFRFDAAATPLPLAMLTLAPSTTIAATAHRPRRRHYQFHRHLRSPTVTDSSLPACRHLIDFLATRLRCFRAMLRRLHAVATMMP